VSAASHHRLVDTIDTAIDVDELVREIERYLAVVDVFRAEGCLVGRSRKTRKEKR
jgi:hypothetical protein